jgi:hypothetical protein
LKVLKCGNGRREKISWTDHARNEYALQTAKEEINILHTIQQRRLTGLITFCV